MRHLLILGLILLAAGPGLHAGSPQWDQDMLSLRIFPLSIHFPAADPDREPLISADGPIIVEISIAAEIAWSLSLAANGDLRGERGARIPISNVTWTASPSPPFREGTLSRGRPVIIAQGKGGMDIRGEVLFFLRNLWDYWPGDYGQTITVTISAL